MRIMDMETKSNKTRKYLKRIFLKVMKYLEEASRESPVAPVLRKPHKSN